ncbi:beta-carotene hydroxylase [Bernardetia sp.]|uniref:beta-carotene hydroxylase n=1 Tax=Bernardetia sp. TaxID=1937974 RepID=UPI0025B81172|nr:beta-carotene hydroxylase [Bernardetia sp.]
MLSLWQIILVIVITAMCMEGVAWFTHKYIMHGFLWFLHKSHHKHHNHFLEVNDVFALVFSVQSMAMIMFGLTYPKWNILFALGVGIALYGIFYAVFHDILVHNRLPFLKINIQNPYLKRIVRAHGVHHRSHKKDDSEAFGFLYAPKKYDKNS